jgi:hypothetical protein
LGTLAFIVYLYLTRVFFTLLLGLFIVATKEKFCGKTLKKLCKFLANGIFFNQILRISLEAYIEFYLIGMMNLYTAEFKMSGELLGVMLTFVALSMIFCVLPTLLLYVLTRKIE